MATSTTINWAACPVLESVPGKLGGAWVFRGTRIPVTTVLNNIADMTPTEIAEDSPPLSVPQIQTVLDFMARSAAS